MAEYLYVDYEHTMDDSAYSDQEYGPWYESYSFSLKDAYLTNSYYRETVPCGFEVNESDMVHVVYAVWSTGNSLGCGERNRFDIISIFKDSIKAEACVESLCFNDFYVDENGVQISYYRPWNGYFEGLDYLTSNSRIVRS